MVINGSYTIKGTLSSNILLFKEVTSEANMTRGANVNLVNGRFYYKIDENNIFEFYNSTEIVPSNGENGTSTIIQECSSENNLTNLLNTTFFSVTDNSNSYLINLNFDSTTDKIKASYSLDKITSSIFKNNIINKYENQTYPVISLSNYKNPDILDTFLSIKFDNSAISTIDQTNINRYFFDDIMEWNSQDISSVLDLLLIENANDHTFLQDSSTYLYNKLFSLNQINYKLELLNNKTAVSLLHNKIFEGESILYFIDNYITFYKLDEQPRVKVYFFDYQFFVYANTFHLFNYIKTVYNNIGDYSNNFQQNIVEYKIAHPDLTTYDKDYTSIEYKVETAELIEYLFESNNAFVNKIDWSSLDVVINMCQWNLKSLNDSTYNEFDLSLEQQFNFLGVSEFKPIVNKLYISEGDLWVPLLEVDFPLDSYFYFMM